MFYLANVAHPARQCPGTESQKFKQFIEKFSANNLSKVRISLLAAYIDYSCLTGSTGKDHLTTFVMEAESIEKIAKVFDSMPVDIRQVNFWENIPGPRKS